MLKVTIKETQNPSILKFEFPEFISRNQNFEFKNIDETSPSPLAKQLFYLPFVKTVYISGNFIAIEKFSIVEWHEVKELVAEQIETFVDKGGKILNIEDSANKKVPVTVYSETTPNPSVMKFVASKMLTKTAVECKNIDETAASPLAKDLFTFPFVKEVFIDENYVSVSKYDVADWMEITQEIRSFIKIYIEEGKTVIDETQLVKTANHEKQQEEYFEKLDATSQQIINILEEYVKPAVQSDGGNIAFQSYDEKEKRVKVILQGACSGCPSSTFTLKSGIENMLKEMLHDQEIKVEAVNG
ncbi:thioredoxin-related protein [Flavobacterium saliperosum S13]|uniref:Fe-S cluster biogenesis protein NfuA, 4Fe-4S-binding domain n=2 Tax=Flavobacterium saliperosum TaxID=329186 RepID=A0A1G4V700_9FLAO|nr:NifU family protein [Flavobacterium saliperosum]ESU27962.1 thioredoxin-related protein [Flavobacterium saliperosum S13]SCX02213.1 Fe-S cluster biogenesis protein NfuA, 4Fe-4S-binding domain [Flavobacterium saliperosum]